MVLLINHAESLDVIIDVYKVALHVTVLKVSVEALIHCIGFGIGGYSTSTANNTTQCVELMTIYYHE